MPSGSRWTDAQNRLLTSGSGSDQGGEGVIELGQGLDMKRKTRKAIMGGRVQHKPGQFVVSLEDVSANINY